jgi:hypothetical protein
MVHIGFVLYHTGETNALIPAMCHIAKNPSIATLSVIPVGVSAKDNLPKSLSKFIIIPEVIKQGLGQNDEFNMYFRNTIIEEVVTKLKNCDVIIIGTPAKIQEQIAKEIPDNIKLITYFDGSTVDPKKLDVFVKYSNEFIVTTKYAKQFIQSHIQEKNILKNIKIFLSRHGNFDIWLQQHTINKKNEAKIRRELCVLPSDKIIVWAGGYGDFSNNDIESQAFLKFLKSFHLFKNNFKLRIAIHPGLKNYNQNKLNIILDRYYKNKLLEFGFTKEEVSLIFTSLDTNTIASVAHAVISLNGMAGSQSIYIKTIAKNIYLNKKYIIEGIESVKSNKRWQEIYNQLLTEKNQEMNEADYIHAVNKLGIPLDTSTKQTIIQIISNLEKS